MKSAAAKVAPVTTASSLNVISQPSPNFDEREGLAIDTIVLHYTGMQSGANALDRLCDKTSKVSAHYLVEEDGKIFQLVPEDKRAWHAGVAHWRGISQVNHTSIGIEIVNPGHEYGYRAFPKVQMDAVAALCKDIMARYRIPRRNVIGHSDVAPDRKEDPGELFDWKGLAEQGIGLWPEAAPVEEMIGNIAGALKQGDKGAAVRILQQNLFDYGYSIPTSGEFCEKTRKVVIAFQRHFRPSNIEGLWDSDCAQRLSSLLNMAD